MEKSELLFAQIINIFQANTHTVKKSSLKKKKKSQWKLYFLLTQ